MFDFNSKKGALLLLVQTWALAAGSQRSSDPLHRARFANACLADVLALDEETIPDDVDQACEELMLYQDSWTKPGAKEHEPPVWFVPRKKTGSGWERLYPWSKS